MCYECQSNIEQGNVSDSYVQNEWIGTKTNFLQCDITARNVITIKLQFSVTYW